MATSAAMIAGFPSNVTLDPLISSLSPFTIFISSLSMYQAGPRWTGSVPVSVFNCRWMPEDIPFRGTIRATLVTSPAKVSTVPGSNIL